MTAHTDRTQREFRIRPVANSRELDTLHRIFYVGGIGGGVVAQETFLVAVDENEFVVGGVGSTRQSSDHVLLDKFAVLPRCRGRGIGRILLDEFLEPMCISQYRLAKDMSVSPRRINEIVHGTRAITADTGLRLARYFGTSERFWLNLQTRYDLEVEKDRLGTRLKREVLQRAV